MNRREMSYLIPLIVLTILFGVYPKPILDVMSVSVEKLIGDYNQALMVIDQAKYALKP